MTTRRVRGPFESITQVMSVPGLNGRRARGAGDAGAGVRGSRQVARWRILVPALVLTTALGLAAKSVETASNTPMFLTLLPFLGSGFVPTDTMPVGLRQFATYQPFTPVTETVGGLLMGTSIGWNGIAAVAWSVGIALVSYLWARHLYNQRGAH